MQDGNIVLRQRRSGIIQDSLQFGFGDIIRIVGVKLRRRCHTQHRAGVHVHHNGAGTVLHIIVINRVGKLGFQHGLDGIVNGQVQVIAVDSRMGIAFLVSQFIAPCVLAADAAPRCTDQFLIIRFFQAVHAVAAVITKAQDRGKVHSVRVFPRGGGFLVHGKHRFVLGIRIPLRLAVGNAFGVGIVNNGLRRYHINALGNHAVLAVRFAQLLLNFFRADAPVQQFADFLAGFRHIILVALGRVGNNVPHHTAFGQQFAVSGINRAARGGDLGIGKLLFRRLNTVLLSIPDLQGIQLINQNAAPRSDKADHQQQNHDASVQRKRMILPRLRAAAVVMTRGLILVVGLLWHRFIPLQKRLFARIRARP